jgi:hypothetical protein
VNEGAKHMSFTKDFGKKQWCKMKESSPGSVYSEITINSSDCIDSENAERIENINYMKDKTAHELSQ